MKKILLLLNLIAFTAISQVTPVGGYLPLNSSKSFTAGNATCSNVIARGTFSVGSTATITENTYMGQNASNTTTLGGVSMGYNTSSGIMHFGKYSATSNAIWGYHSSTPTTSNYNLNFDANNAYFNSPSALFLVTNGTIRASYGTSSSYNTLPLRVGSNSAPTATLDVTGDAKVSSTFSLGSANLTGGNTGTVAVLSDAMFAVNLGGGLVSTPADGSTYYYGNISGVFTQQGFGKLYMPYNVTLIGWTYNAWITSVASSSESSTLSINIDNSATNLNTSITFSVASGVNTYSNSGLSINVNSGSYIEAKLINPTWATNPQGVNSGITFWFVRRS